ncbi:hypothetical protein BAAM0483_01955 [Bifidobacterium animalis subsp. animalis MCC 0483]|uniref:Uncharacterized protein n=1 Tax=Bifidobacterium animalis subsp. animalis MCC 0483 TaxID=1365955 RepID=A0AB34TAF8_9BIFI|nr:hypothetical protein [Bifidobacterium animalis]KOA51051.1 hypothetical protein BAAM0483_01955 [Bifidobacterium animalis subsp. animalis MCC 0483]
MAKFAAADGDANRDVFDRNTVREPMYRSRYQVCTDKKTGITNDLNLYSDDPRYIVDLVCKVITVSLRTLDIVESLPHWRDSPSRTTGLGSGTERLY